MDFLDSFRPIRAKWLKTSKRMPFTLANVSNVKQTTIVIIARNKWEREKERKTFDGKKHTENMNAKYKHEMQRHATPPLNHWYENRCRCKGVPLQRKNTNHSIKCVEYFWKVSIARYINRGNSLLMYSEFLSIQMINTVFGLLNVFVSLSLSVCLSFYPFSFPVHESLCLVFGIGWFSESNVLTLFFRLDSPIILLIKCRLNIVPAQYR